MTQVDQIIQRVTSPSAGRLTESASLVPSDSAPKVAEAIERDFTQFSKAGKKWRPVGPIVLVPEIKPGAYEISCDMQGVYFEAVKPTTDALMNFPDSNMDKVIAEIAKFWGRRESYANLGLMHNRGILMAGKPGVGKSCCLQQVVESMVSQGNVVFFANSASSILEGLRSFRQVEPSRPVVVAFEEADELASHNERTLLQLMDGDSKVDHVLFLGTTNYPERLSDRMIRPGRFDRLVQIKPPTLEHRVAYLTKKLGALATAEEVTEMAKRTDGLGFGHLRELVAGVYAIGDPVDHVIARLRGGRITLESEDKGTSAKVLARLKSAECKTERFVGGAKPLSKLK